MLVVTLLTIIAILFFALIVQAKRYKGQAQGKPSATSVVKEKPKDRRVSYLEPKVTALPVDLPESDDQSDTILDLDSEKNMPAIDNDNDSNEADDASNSAPEWVILYLQATKDKPYSGYELLQALLSSGLRFGKNNIFHRFQSKTSKGDVLFSLASAIQPGTFDLPNMGGFSTVGLTLMLDLNKVKDPMAAFELMLHTAGQLTEDLGGQVLDSQRDVLTKETVREICLTINRIEKSTRNLDLFAQIDT